MTQQQLIQEFRSYPKVKKSQVVRQLLQILEEDLAEKPSKELSIEERMAIVERLSGIAAVEGKTPPTDEEVKEDYINYIVEKYK
jgi:parvulin-like peptidyl-prolyl isomerase